MPTKDMIKIRFGGGFKTSTSNLERVVDLIIRSRAAKVSTSIDSNFIIELVQEVLRNRRQPNSSDDSIVDLDELRLSDDSEFDFEAIFLGEEELPELDLPKLEVEEFRPYDSAESESYEDDIQLDSHISLDTSEEEEEEEEEVKKPVKRVKSYARGNSYWMDNRFTRFWVAMALIVVIVFNIIVCASYF